MSRLLVVDVVGMTPDLLAHMPRVRRVASTGFTAELGTVLPAVTCSVQSTFLTGTPPRDHGIVGNGWYFRDLGEVLLWRQHNALVQGKWLQWTLRPLTRDLEGKTLGLVGFGRTGRATAQRALGFGVRLLACDPYISLTPEERARFGGIELVSRERLLRESDIVVCHVPLTDETRHMVDRAFLAQMKPTSYLINISRGGVVDQDALVEALRARRIAGAGLDVFTPEPLAPGHPLTTLDNVVLTPHVGAGTLDAFRTKMAFALGNIQRVVQGDPPLERVAGT